MTTLSLETILERLGACDDARKWAESQPDLQTAWKNCKRSDWMIWLLARTVIDKNDPRLRLMACDFAEAVLHLVPAGEDRPRKAIEAARRFAMGEATNEERAAAWDAAWAAAWAAAGDAARDAAWAAAGDAAWAAAWAAARDAAGAAARDAAGAAARDAAGDAARDAAWDAAWDAARDAAWAAQSDIIRHYFPECPRIKPTIFRG